MVKLIACDIDGTLLQNGEKTISACFFQEARRLMAKGMAFCAASGRQYSSLRSLFAPIANDMVYLCENGAIVYGGGEILGKTVIDRDMALKLCHEILERENCEVLISGADMSYLCPKGAEIEHHMRYAVGNKVTVLASPEEMPEDFLKISAFCTSGAAGLESEMAPAWEKLLRVAVAGVPWLDFTPADKGDGMKHVCRVLNIAPDEVMAFGDNYNDVSMLDLVGHPYIMSTADAPLLARFPHHADRVEDVLKTL